MARIVKKKHSKQLTPYWYNPNIFLFYELEFKKQLVTPGMLLKIKFERSVFRFDRLVVNTETGKEWVDVYDTSIGGWRSFYPDKISTILIKKSRALKK